MIATSGKSLNVHKAQSRGDAKRTRAVPGAPHRYSNHNPLQSQASKAAAHTPGTASRGRPVTQLRTIAETAELLNTSTRTVRRFIASGALPVHRLGRSVRISDADIAAFLAATRSA
jgi:excisionase family DNA binding protein